MRLPSFLQTFLKYFNYQWDYIRGGSDFSHSSKKY